MWLNLVLGRDRTLLESCPLYCICCAHDDFNAHSPTSAYQLDIFTACVALYTAYPAMCSTHLPSYACLQLASMCSSLTGSLSLCPGPISQHVAFISSTCSLLSLLETSLSYSTPSSLVSRFELRSPLLIASCTLSSAREHVSRCSTFNASMCLFRSAMGCSLTLWASSGTAASLLGSPSHVPVQFAAPSAHSRCPRHTLTLLRRLLRYPAWSARIWPHSVNQS